VRVGIDVRPAARAFTGIGRYIRGLVPAVAAAGHDVIALSASLRDRFPRDALPGATIVDRRIPVRLLDYAWSRGRWPSFTRLAGPVDVVHSPTPLPIPAGGAAQVATIHDLFFARAPVAAGATASRFWRRAIERARVEADAIVCPSAYTASQAADLLGDRSDRLYVVHHGLEPRWFARDEGADRSEAELTGPGRYLLAVGATEPRKNYPRLVSAFDRARRAGLRDVRLVIVGPRGGAHASIVDVVRRLGIDDAVTLIGYRDDAVLRRLYRGAVALVMPSLDEGFGFPVIEAMAAGCPVLAARAGALPEIAGDAAIYVDPFDEEEMLEALRQVAGDDELRTRLTTLGAERARRYTWSQAARNTIDVYERAVARRRLDG